MTCFLYVLKCESFFKVGISSTVDARIMSINTSTPFDVSLVHLIEFDSREEASISEKIAHATLTERGWHQKLEWFNAPLHEVVDVCNSSAEVGRSESSSRVYGKIQKSIRILNVSKLDFVSDVTKIPEDKLKKFISGEEKMTSSELARILTVWGD